MRKARRISLTPWCRRARGRTLRLEGALGATSPTLFTGQSIGTITSDFPPTALYRGQQAGAGAGEGLGLGLGLGMAPG